MATEAQTATSTSQLPTGPITPETTPRSAASAHQTQLLRQKSRPPHSRGPPSLRCPRHHRRLRFELLAAWNLEQAAHPLDEPVLRNEANPVQLSEITTSEHEFSRDTLLNAKVYLRNEPNFVMELFGHMSPRG